MKLLERRKTPVSRLVIYLSSLGFSLVIILQQELAVNDGKAPSLDHILIFTVNYFIWATLIDWINGAVVSAANSDNEQGRLRSLLVLVGRLLLILSSQFILSNLLYYGIIMGFTDSSLNESLHTLQQVFPRAILSRAIDLAVILFILKLIETYQSLSRQKLEMVTLENQLRELELQSLKAQLNPHFLFNALHAVNTMIGVNDTKARSMIIKIGNLLRKIITQKDQQLVTLNDELETVVNYLDIEQERFHDRLSIDVRIEERTRQLKIPSLLLQPLMENAFKHGISKVEGKGRVLISSELSGDRVVLHVQNTCPDAAGDSITWGVGLGNLKRRLRELYRDKHDLRITRNGTIFMVEVSIQAEP